jgi:hypothetical protein
MYRGSAHRGASLKISSRLAREKLSVESTHNVTTGSAAKAQSLAG